LVRHGKTSLEEVRRCYDSATIGGNNQDLGLEGATVSVQIYNSNADHKKDKVKIYTSTLTDKTVSYMMYELSPPKTVEISSHLTMRRWSDGEQCDV